MSKIEEIINGSYYDGCYIYIYGATIHHLDQLGTVRPSQAVVRDRPTRDRPARPHAWATRPRAWAETHLPPRASRRIRPRLCANKLAPRSRMADKIM
jgi:hypothetical protein